MRICAFSDMHGKLDFKVEPCDIVLIAGDIVPLRIQNYTNDSEKWFKTVFIPWCTNLPCEKVVFIGGNHDKFLYNHSDRLRALLEGQDKVIYLSCETFEYKGRVIFGTPWCKVFGNWSFMLPYEEQDKMYDALLDKLPKIDIMLSHDAPYGVSDVILQKDCWWADGSHIGNESLKRFVEKVNPDYLLHGHLHTTSRECEMLNNTQVYNVSLLDEYYEIVFEPQYFELQS